MLEFHSTRILDLMFKSLSLCWNFIPHEYFMCFWAEFGIFDIELNMTTIGVRVQQLLSHPSGCFGFLSYPVGCSGTSKLLLVQAVGALLNSEKKSFF